jgi:hypothetical protein
MKQIEFVDKENNCTHGGILTDDGDVICGCCGGLFEADEKGTTWDLVREIEWVNLDETILEGI